MNQHKRIAEYIENHGSITPMEAFMQLGITKLSTRINEMIRSGYEVDKVMESRVRDDGSIVRYMRYYRKAA